VIEEGVDDCNNPFDRFNLVDVRQSNVAVSMMNAETVRAELSMLPIDNQAARGVFIIISPNNFLAKN